MKRLIELTTHSGTILRQRHWSLGDRLRLLGVFYKLVLRRFLSGRFGRRDFTNERFLGFTLTFNRYIDFYNMFRESFINEEYTFVTDKTEPFIIDAGSNVGVPLSYFKRLYPKAQITLFEPLPENVEYLKTNIADNKLTGVTLEAAAVGSQAGTLTLYGKQQSGSLVADKVAAQENDNQALKTEVPVVRLSEYIGERTVDFIKLDIEGAEADVFYDLASSGKLRQVRQLVLEYHFFALNENRLSDIVRRLEDNGFQTMLTSDLKNLRDFPQRPYHRMLVFAKQI